MKYLEEFANTLDNQSEDNAVSFFDQAAEDLDNVQQRKALRLGALSITAAVYGYKIREKWYGWRFRRAIKKLEGADN